jgi:hypothetical protein
MNQLPLTHRSTFRQPLDLALDNQRPALIELMALIWGALHEWDTQQHHRHLQPAGGEHTMTTNTEPDGDA